MLSNLVLLGALAAQVTHAISKLSPETEAVCGALLAKYPDQVAWDPLGPHGLETLGGVSDYNTANSDYWNAKSASNRASCTLFPSSAQEVSFAVKLLNEYPSVRYATKGGGHNPNLGFSSVDEGVLLSFRPNSQYANPSADGNTVEVGAGAKWEDVYTALEPLNKAAVGGRLGDVGAMGLVLGGGLSYLSSQYGLACDNVVNFEVILADGTIDNANATHNEDLFFALRGGGNQYAIVSKMTLKTYDIGDDGMVWGGTRAYTGDKHDEILAAISNFTANNEDPKAAVILTFNFVGLVGIDVPAILIFYFYDGSEPHSGVFDEFDAIPALIKDTKTRTYNEVTQVALAGDYDGLRFQIRENTFPNLPVGNMTSFLNDHYTLLAEKASEGDRSDLLDIRLMTFAVQPLTTLITRASEEAGGNALGLKAADGDRIWIEYDLAWLSPLCDEDCPGYLRTVADAAHDMHEEKYSGIEPTHYRSGDLEYLRYNPIFMNDAMADQKVLESYGDEMYNRLKGVAIDYDPTGFFATRQGGWKFTT